MIQAEYFWNIVMLLAIGTLAIRGSFIAISSRVKITERTREIFSYIPVAILPALIAPAVFFHQGKVSWLLGKERFLMMILSTILCFFFKSTFITIVFGLGGLYLLTQ
ncbi:MAG: AzlD domain-containing protein [Xanthomonadaceae bacterium]|nr:AzlD domain-containing protein [Xanthomonadaceae bacterium]